jgi:uroporphyrinogen-III synthase
MLLILQLQCVMAAVVCSDYCLKGVTVVVTAPVSYAPRLASHLEAAGARVLFLPTMATEFLSDNADLRTALLDKRHDFVAFTSRRGIQAAIKACGQEEVVEHFNEQLSRPVALGADKEALTEAGVQPALVLTPADPTPLGTVNLLSDVAPPSRRRETSILCPIPMVTGGLTEPPVVPNFLAALKRQGFHVETVVAYQTRWTGPSSEAKALLAGLSNSVNCIAISSTAEVEGLQLLCQHYGVTLPRHIKVVAHGPVTAAGAEALGLSVDAVSKNFSSFAGTVEAIARCMGREGKKSARLGGAEADAQ